MSVFNLGGFIPGGGGMSDSSKEGRRREDIARQAEEVRSIGNEFLSQLAPNSPEFNEFSAFISEMVERSAEGAFAVSQLGGRVLDQQAAVREFGAQLARQQSTRIAEGGAAGPLEERTNLAFEGLRETVAPVDFEQDVFNALTGADTFTTIGQALSRQVERAAAPEIDDEVFKLLLDSVVDRVNVESAGRGILGGGLRLEQIGRLGNEAAIAESFRQDQLRQEAFLNAGGIFDVGESLRGREIGLESGLVDIQLGREVNLSEIINKNEQARLSDLRGLTERRTTQATADRLDAADAEATRKAALGESIGQGLAIAAAPFTGGASLALIPAAGNIGKGLGGGGPAPQSANELLSAQRAQTTPSGTPVSTPLGRTPKNQSNEDFAALLRALQNA